MMQARAHFLLVSLFLTNILAIGKALDTDLYSRESYISLRDGHSFFLHFPETLTLCNFTAYITPTFTETMDFTVAVRTIGTGDGMVTTIVNLGEMTAQSISMNEGIQYVLIETIKTNRFSVVAGVDCQQNMASSPRTAAYLALPSEFLGPNYVIVTPPSLTCEYSVVIVNGGKELAKCTIDLKIRPVGSSPEVQIMGDSFNKATVTSRVVPPTSRLQININNADITGSVITSTYSVAVFFGPRNVGSNLYSNRCLQERHLFMEQLVPNYALGAMFFMQPSLVANTNATFRVVASENNTWVHTNFTSDLIDSAPFDFRNKHLLEDVGDILDLPMSTDAPPDFMVSDKPVSVLLQILPENGGDGAATLVVPFLAGLWSGPFGMGIFRNGGSDVSLASHDSCSITPSDPALRVEAVVLTSLFDNYTSMHIRTSNTNNPRYGTLKVGTACKGVSGYVLDRKDDGTSNGAHPVGWGLFCKEGQFFNYSLRQCKDNVIDITTETPVMVTTDITTETPVMATTDITTETPVMATTEISQVSTAGASKETTASSNLSNMTNETESPGLFNETDRSRPSKQCPCKCKTGRTTQTFQQMKKMAEERAVELKKELKVPVKTTSVRRRAKASSIDSRSSAFSAGLVGVAIIVAVVVAVVLPDTMRAVQFCSNYFSAKHG